MASVAPNAVRRGTALELYDKHTCRTLGAKK
jgi:hypothetical protein